MRDADIVVKSSFGHDIKNWLLGQEPESGSLAVLFPGGDGICDIPLLHYARKVALQLKCDVLSLEYGYVRTDRPFSPEYRPEAVRETAEAVKACNPERYERVYFISKSFGTLVAGEVSQQLRHLPIRSLYLTPIEGTVPYLSESDCTVVMGDKDRLFPDVFQIRQLPNVTLHVFENAGHSLEWPDDYKRSLEILKGVSDICRDFILAG